MPLDDILREEAQLTRAAFSRLLQWLDDGVGSQSERYLEMRRRLVSYFDRRNRPSADDLAGETLRRIARTLEKDGAISITPPARYCYVVAKCVLHEDVRCEPLHVALGEPGIAVASAGHGVAPHEPGAALTIEGQRPERVGWCLQALKPEQRQVVVDYYRGTGRRTIERRRDMAKGLGLTLDALGIRAFRIRRAPEASDDHSQQARRLRDRLWTQLQEALGAAAVVLNGHPSLRLPTTLNVSFVGRIGADILARLDGVAASTGAACHSESVELSPVLAARVLRSRLEWRRFASAFGAAPPTPRLKTL